MFGNDQIKVYAEIFQDKYIQKQIAELICQFNYNKDLLSIYGVKKVRKNDIDELFPQIATVKFIEDKKEG